MNNHTETGSLQAENDLLRQRVAHLEQVIRSHQQPAEALRVNSERRYQEITELLSDAVYSVQVNADGTLIFDWGTRSFEKLTGFDLSGISLDDWQRLVHPDDWELFQQRLEHLAAGRPVESEYRMVTRDGQVRWLRDYGRPVLDPQDGRLTQVYGAVKDVTAYKRAGQSLRESERMLSTLMRNLPGMAYRCRNNWHWEMEFVSEGSKALTGYAPAALTGSAEITYGDLIHPEDRQMVWDEVQTALAEHRPFHLTYRIRAASGEEKWVWEQGMGVFLDPGGFLALEGFVTDISRQKQIEAALRESEAQIRQHAARVEALVHVASRLNAQLDLATVLHNVCEETARALSVDVVVVCLYHEATDTLDYAYGIGVPADAATLILPFPRAYIDTMTQRMGSVRVFSDAQEFGGLMHRDLLSQARVGTLVGTNIVREGQLTGVLSAATIDRGRTFTDNELLLMRGIANQAAQAIANARLFDTMQQERTLLARRVHERTAELSRTNAKLARAVRARDEFLANMSHELRTPLNAILGLTESLQEYIYGPVNERQAKTLQTIEASGRHLLDLINDVLDLAKIEAGRMDLYFDAVTIETVCQASLQFVRQQARRKHIEVFFKQDTDLEVIHADTRRLKQILVNLLSNAVKFTPEHGSVGLEVTANEERGVIFFTIWDTGIGIAREHMGRLFQSFVQLDSSLSREHVGTGLGLSLVARLSELHGGSVSVESELGLGSRFTVCLPIYRTEREGVRVAEEETDGDGPDPFLSDAQEAPLILLAEDNEANIDLYSEYLERKGYRVVVARNGHEVLDRVREECPSLILMDIQMPRLNGLEAIHRIRADACLASIPIIALTALAMPDDRERCLEAGANEYLSKPVSLKELWRAIGQLLAGR
ncbi:MAG: PAS domain-containing protein [Chloroflexaceae bacterium]|nr:PAS domain-containing protein [Chloroflexaceae bacterium]